MFRPTRTFALALASTAVLAAGCASASITETTAIESLTAAFADTAAAPSYRIEQSQGQSISSSALGVDATTALDPDRPDSVLEVTSAGTYAWIDITAAIGPLAEPGAEPLVFEIWTDPAAGLTVIDTTAYAALVAANPMADLGPFSPGVFSVDDDGLAELDQRDLATAVGGSAADLATIGAEMPRVLRDMEQEPDAPLVYRGTSTLAELYQAQGVDLDSMARGMAAGIGLASGLDAGVIAGVYIDFFEQTDASVEVTLTEDELIHEIRFEADLSGIYRFLFASEAFRRSTGASELEVAAAAEMFADTVWTQEVLMRFVPDPDLVLKPMPTPTEDRTDEIVEFMLASGAFDR